MADIKKMLETVSLQLVLVIVMGIASVMISSTLYSGITTYDDFAAASANPLSIVSLLLGIATWVVIGWAGYVWVKEIKGTGIDGGKAGVLVAGISGIITGYLSMVYIYPTLARIYAAVGVAAAASSLGVTTYIIGVIGSVVIGFIIGLIGGHFGKEKK